MDLFELQSAKTIALKKESRMIRGHCLLRFSSSTTEFIVILVFAGLQVGLIKERPNRLMTKNSAPLRQRAQKHINLNLS